MFDLKPCLDAVNAAKDEEQRIANEIQSLLAEGTEESTLKAVVELQPKLDEAQKKLAQAESLYESMQSANRPNDIAKNFVPVSNAQPGDEVDQQPTTIKRAEYNKLSLVDQAKFIRSGGTVED
jgi:hypothetical protein